MKQKKIIRDAFFSRWWVSKMTGILNNSFQILLNLAQFYHSVKQPHPLTFSLVA